MTRLDVGEPFPTSPRCDWAEARTTAGRPLAAGVPGLIQHASKKYAATQERGAAIDRRPHARRNDR